MDRAARLLALEALFTGHPGQALVAIYTLNQPTREVQNVAYSLDNGLTYTNYSGNPVLNLSVRQNQNQTQTGGLLIQTPLFLG
jgi:sucrose-6-phosphate hydrolase SacC (GH32 family)